MRPRHKAAENDLWRHTIGQLETGFNEAAA